MDASTLYYMDDGTANVRKFVCSKREFREKRYMDNKNRVKRPRAITREGCKAMMMVMKIDSGKWVIRKFVKDHNHLLAKPGEVQYLRSCKKMTNTAQHIIDTYTNAGLRPCLIMAVLSQEAGGSDNLAFADRHCQNHIAKSREKIFEKGYLKLVLEYFRNMQFENPAFFYAMQVDENGHLSRIFWADARSRMNYQIFGDVVVFDSTYVTNKYRMPFASFTGVNHHHQSVLFGCALLVDQSEESFVWLFKTWLQAKSGHHPTFIITD
ncbi:protein FAR1-RELATED SEQUENCE 5-like [Amborella trichopoda]|uniref:protein FAR1-RELATED SEQUENCE 5-like n=1 Tax=Amborella trichopoda TaxID=13333 RepID=UPI0005D3D840|nr:protein FAR1-RELATED SEQUENCE 5-like [Amborella trichopoda]|eukprot:XP_011627225.1 protein FAR1-RELATED SEQUENCE 5-like [Amborella trichopoda]